MSRLCILPDQCSHFALLAAQQVIGDASPDASKLMKREGVRSVPSFHYFVGGEKVDVVNGANAEAIEAAITKHTK
jgi:thioredoxin 1